MEAERWRKVQELYHSALEREESQRADFIRQACGGDESLEQEVESLVAHTEGDQSFLEAPALQVAAQALARSGTLAGAPSVPAARSFPPAIGRYRIVRVLGEGAMGIVYEAEQEQPRRRVALKVIKPGFATEQSWRFEHESMALGRLQHAGIAQIYEAGTADTGSGQQPYFAMELIRGQSLLVYAKTHHLDTRQRLALTAKICAAAQHAHQRGLIHRDLKPGNILVDETGQPKILDFGVARATDSDAQTTRQTGLGQIVGTLAYMSPEQVLADPQQVDTRSDVYSLGVILYELLSGRLPYEVNHRQLHQALQTIREVDPASLSSLNRTYRGDIETIVGKALEKDKARRYATAADLAADIQHYLNNEPITARPQSAVYQLQKFAWRHRAWAAGVAAVFVLFVALAAGAFWFLPRVPKLSERDTIVLADITNTTGDPVFDGSLRRGLAAQLEQSPFLNLLPDQRVVQTLLLMARPKDAPLTQELAREVCLRTASAAVLSGGVAQIGTRYLLTLNAIGCGNGESLATTDAQASDKNHVLDALGKIATEIRSKLGESLVSVQKYDAPPENVTTPSLEALQAYSLGYRAMVVRGDGPAAIPLFQQAISLDHNFAMAYARLGTAYFNSEQTKRAIENIQKAYELRDRVSERERLYIAAHQADIGTRNFEAARNVYESWAQIYPRDEFPPGNLGVIYVFLGDYDKALASDQAARKLNPGNGNVLSNVAMGLMQLNRPEEAKVAFREAQSLHVNPGIGVSRYALAFIQHDTKAMEQEAAELMGKPGYEDPMLHSESDTAAYGGHFAQARELTRRACDSAQRADNKEAAAAYRAESAVREALAGNVAQAKQQARDSLSLSQGRDVMAIASIALALAGDAHQATQLAARLARENPEDTVVQFNALPAIKAASVLRSDPGKAIEELAKSAPYELGETSQVVSFSLYPIYLRGEAYLAARQGAGAAAEFQKILAHPGLVKNEPIGAMARLGLGRASVLLGDTGKAKSAYQEFLALWKDADSDLPMLKQARAEYAKLP